MCSLAKHILTDKPICVKDFTTKHSNIERIITEAQMLIILSQLTLYQNALD